MASKKYQNINLNNFAKEVTLAEGGKIELSIAQVKEVIKLVFIELNEYNSIQILKTVDKYSSYY